jgi:hypothetical protein
MQLLGCCATVVAKTVAKTVAAHVTTPNFMFHCVVVWQAKGMGEHKRDTLIRDGSLYECARALALSRSTRACAHACHCRIHKHPPIPNSPCVYVCACCNCVSFANFMRDVMGVFLVRVRVCDAAGFGTVFSTLYHGLRRRRNTGACSIPRC